MKIKIKEFEQHLYHEIYDEDKAEEYVGEALSYIGLVVMYFNSLEASLDGYLCQIFTDRSDSTGLIVLNKMNYASKVELFKRFCDDFDVCTGSAIAGYELLINILKEAGRLRNLVVHANWESTDEEGYTFVRLKMSKKGMQQEYVQFSTESLQKVVNLIVDACGSLGEYWELRDEALHGSS